MEEVLQIALEMRRRVKELLKQLGGMEFYDVNFSYIDNESIEEHDVIDMGECSENIYGKEMK